MFDRLAILSDSLCRRPVQSLLLTRSGGTSLLNKRDLLFVGHTMDVPQVLSTALGCVSRKMSLGCGGGQG